MKINIAIAHAAWSPDRHATLERLVSELAPQGAHVEIFISHKPEHASVWAKRLWEFVNTRDADAVICLNDDVTVHPKLVEIVEAMLGAVMQPRIICLHTNAPVAPSLATCGEAWLQSDWLTGPGYVLTPHLARMLLDFIDRYPRGFVESVNEDNLAIQFMHATIPALHSIPALVRHDTSVPSTLGYDDHELRQITVPWDDYGIELCDPEYWRRIDTPVEVENPWAPYRTVEIIENAIRIDVRKPLDGEPRIALAIIHAAHRPERRPLLDRLEKQLGIVPYKDEGVQTWTSPPGPISYRTETTRGPARVWQERSLDYFQSLRDQCSEPPTHCLTLQDDVTVSPDFWGWLSALIQGRPNDVICLDCAHPAARQVFVEGKAGYTTADCMVGIGHVLPVAVMSDFRRWRVQEVRPQFLEQYTSEDVLLGLYCMARQERIFCPVPAMIDHDLDIGSTNEGYDTHIYRRPQVTWKDVDRVSDWVARLALMSDRDWWAQPVEHLGRFYENAHHLFPLVLKDAELAQWLVERYGWTVENIPKRHQKFFLRASALGGG